MNYPFSISVIIPLDLKVLIAASLPSVIDVSVSGGTPDSSGQVFTNPTAVNVLFPSPLSDPDVATMNGIVAAYNPLASVQAIADASMYATDVTIIKTAFDVQTQVGLVTLLSFILLQRLTTPGALANRLAYLMGYFTWAGNIYNACLAAQAAINAALTPAAALAVTFGPTQIKTGDLTASTHTIANLSSTVQISVGMVVTGTGITGTTCTVATVPSGTSVTLSGGTLANQSGQSYTFTLPAAPNVTIQGATAINN
jgi:hypothetical protein